MEWTHISSVDVVMVCWSWKTRSCLKYGGEIVKCLWVKSPDILDSHYCDSVKRGNVSSWNKLGKMIAGTEHLDMEFLCSSVWYVRKIFMIKTPIFITAQTSYSSTGIASLIGEGRRRHNREYTDAICGGPLWKMCLVKTAFFQAELTHRYRFLSLSITSIATGPVGPQKSSSVPSSSTHLSLEEAGEYGLKGARDASFEYSSLHSSWDSFSRESQAVVMLCLLSTP